MSGIMCPNPDCDEGPFVDMGKHWTSERCEHPPLTQRQYEICVGLLMGDGTIGNRNKTNQLIQVKMITREYLEYLDSIFDILSTGVRFHLSAEESAKEDRESGFRPNAKAETYSDQYRWNTRSHPEITKLTSWYDSGKKVWPKDIDLTPTVLKHWFVGDGSFNNYTAHRNIGIGLFNERENEEKVALYFERAGLPRPNRWYRREDNCTAHWNKNQSEELWKYMLSDGYGIPPGFEYKWPSEYHHHAVDQTTTTAEAIA